MGEAATTSLNIEQACALRRPHCRHMWRPDYAEGWWDTRYCGSEPLRGSPFCFAHMPLNYRQFMPASAKEEGNG